MSDSCNEIECNAIHFHESNHMMINEASLYIDNETVNNSDSNPHNMQLNTKSGQQISHNVDSIQSSSPVTTQLNAKSQDLRYRLISTEKNINAHLNQTNDNTSEGDVNFDLGPHNVHLNTTSGQVSQNVNSIQFSSSVTTQLNAKSHDLRYRLKSTDNNTKAHLNQTNDNTSQEDINFLFWNINRISDKLYDGCDIYELFSKYAVILLSETWLDPCDSLSFNG
ncbi:unnamed protein product, partial [Owenia fusiformis]